MVGAGIGIGYAVKKTKKQDVISFDHAYNPSLNVGEDTVVSATSSIGSKVTLEAEGNGKDTN
jgi:hypothetical protein